MRQAVRRTARQQHPQQQHHHKLGSAPPLQIPPTRTPCSAVTYLHVSQHNRGDQWRLGFRWNGSKCSRDHGGRHRCSWRWSGSSRSRSRGCSSNSWFCWDRRGGAGACASTGGRHCYRSGRFRWQTLISTTDVTVTAASASSALPLLSIRFTTSGYSRSGAAARREHGLVRCRRWVLKRRLTDVDAHYLALLHTHGCAATQGKRAQPASKLAVSSGMGTAHMTPAPAPAQEQGSGTRLTWVNASCGRQRRVKERRTHRRTVAGVRDHTHIHVHVAANLS